MNDEILQVIRKKCEDLDSVLVTNHARKRIKERGIPLSDIINILRSGEIIENYPNDFPYPSCLMLGRTNNGSPLHICVAWGDDILRLITLYIPSPDKWENDFKTRKAVK